MQGRNSRRTMRPSLPPKANHAFTLIELLVVIAIIAILAAILFPVFAQAREKARQATCLSNLKQIGLGMMQYVQDYDELYPGTNFAIAHPRNRLNLPDGRFYQGNIAWPVQIYPYVKNVGVFSCISDPNNRLGYSDNGTVNPYDTAWGKPLPMTYGINELMYLHGGVYATAYGNAGPLSLAKLTFPADTYLAADTNGQFALLFNNGAQAATAQAEAATYGVFNRIRLTRPCPDIEISAGQLRLRANATNPDACTHHNGGSIILYADGHAKWSRWNSMRAYKSTPDRTNQ
jgi:prepilin-type N-terminal cleavage/methylation domain-containing protein/prepilin-type processing-associated H-X9-DG protein